MTKIVAVSLLPIANVFVFFLTGDELPNIPNKLLLLPWKSEVLAWGDLPYLPPY